MKILTISYHNEHISEECYGQLRQTAPNADVYLLDNNYPLLKSKDHVKNLCEKYKFKYFNAETNLGLHEGYNYLMKQCDDDVVILYDGDSYPITKNWDKALTTVHEDPLVVWSSLYSIHPYREMDERGFTVEVIQGYICRVTKAPVINSISAFKRSWVDSVGGFSEPHKYYGGLEIAMWRKKLPEFKWVFLNNYAESAPPSIDLYQDKIYVEYKWAHAHKGDPRSFEEYVSNRRAQDHRTV